MLKRLLKKYLRRIEKVIIERDDATKLLLGKQLCFSQKNVRAKSLSEIEFKVFSQWGEDGIIEFLLSHIPIENRFFIEFGVENYNESNTRFLMMNRNWSGLVFDGSSANINYLKNRDYFWKYELTAIDSFITKENINNLINSQLELLNIGYDIGLLSIDIDGVDYWVLKEIRDIKPSIIICEYNSVFGNDYPLTVPYDKGFIRSDKHYSNLYFGANLKAFNVLLNDRGYIYIGSNMQNSNAFFVNKVLAEKYVPELLSVRLLVEESKIRESRSEEGDLTYLSGKKRLETIQDLELVNLDENRKIKIKELL